MSEQTIDPKYYVLVTKDGIRSEMKPLGANNHSLLKFITCLKQRAGRVINGKLEEASPPPKIREYRRGREYLVVEYEEV